MLRVAAEGATTPGNTGSQKEAGVRFKADCNLGKSLATDCQMSYFLLYWLNLSLSCHFQTVIYIYFIHVKKVNTFFLLMQIASIIK